MIITDKSFETIKKAVDRAVSFAAPTFGPASNKVFIYKQTHYGVYDDGVQVLRDIELDDEAENAIVKLIKEVSGRTWDRAGDGTMGALILLRGILEEYEKSKKTPREAELELKKALVEAVTQLKAQAKPIESKADLKNAALISYDNEDVAEVVAELYHQLGKDGVITIKPSVTINTSVELSEGVKLPYGYVSPLMAGAMDEPHVLVTDLEVKTAEDVTYLMETIVKETNQRQLVLICRELDGFALATVNANLMQQKFALIAVDLPKGDHQQKLLDIALLLGTRVVSESNGDRLDKVTINDFGKCKRFVCEEDESVIIGPNSDKDLLGKKTIELRLERETEADLKKKKAIDKRLAFLTNKVAVIHLGAPTENELKSIRRKVENCIASVKSAFNHGVVAGGGEALANIKTSSEILNNALQYPRKVLWENVGKTHSSLKKGEAVNAVTMELGDFMEVGVCDPVNALIAGIENAVSVAGLLLTIQGIYVETPKDHGKETTL